MSQLHYFKQPNLGGWITFSLVANIGLAAAAGNNFGKFPISESLYGLGWTFFGDPIDVVFDAFVFSLVVSIFGILIAQAAFIGKDDFWTSMLRNNPEGGVIGSRFEGVLLLAFNFLKAFVILLILIFIILLVLQVVIFITVFLSNMMGNAVCGFGANSYLGKNCSMAPFEWSGAPTVFDDKYVDYCLFIAAPVCAFLGVAAAKNPFGKSNGFESGKVKVFLAICAMASLVPLGVGFTLEADGFFWAAVFLINSVLFGMFWGLSERRALNDDATQSL